MKNNTYLRFTVLLCGLMFASGVSSVSGYEAYGSRPDEIFKKERRIFLWDVTISMVGATQNADCPKGKKRSSPDFNYAGSGFPYYNEEKDIYDRTRDVLINKIMQITNESTEVIVLPFRNGIAGEFRACADAEGKQYLKEQIMRWNDLRPGGTYTATCLKQAVDTYFTPDRINRLVLLTDGEPSDGEGQELLKYIHEWKGLSETMSTGCYLVYVMLTDEADNDRIKDVAEDNPDQIQIITPDQDFDEHVTIAVARNVSLYVRDYFSGKISDEGEGEFSLHYSFIEGSEIPEDSGFYFTVVDNEFIEIDSDEKIEPEDGYFTIPFRFRKSFEDIYSALPHDSDFVLEVTCRKDEDSRLIDISGGSTIDLSLVVRPEPRAVIGWSVKSND